jgi:ABC-type dipeptide/oligopeptide/nickel transport system permease subunit
MIAGFVQHPRGAQALRLHRAAPRGTVAVMALVVYALFDRASVASTAELAVRSEHGRGGAGLVQSFDRGPLDGNGLPDGATEFGRNLAIAMLAGAAFMGIAGGIAGALDLLLGMGVGLGIALGFVTGLLMGLVGAMQAGTRIPKRELRELQSRITEGRVLIVVEAARKSDVALVCDTLERFEPCELGTI